jgi:hypothetical protein
MGIAVDVDDKRVVWAIALAPQCVEFLVGSGDLLFSEKVSENHETVSSPIK